VRAPIAVLFAALLLAGCAPGRYDPPTLEPTGSAIDGLYQAPVEDVRRALDGVLRERRLDVDVDDPVLGAITTAFVTTPADLEELACTGFADAEGRTVDGIRYRLRIELARRGRALTRVRVYADVQGHVRGDGIAGVWTDCASTGEIERGFLDAVQRALRRD